MESTDLERAKAGSPNAIAAILNTALKRKGTTAEVTSNGEQLRVVLQGQAVPSQKLANLVMRELAAIELQTICRGTLVGLKMGEDQPRWCCNFDRSNLESGQINLSQSIKQSSSALSTDVDKRQTRLDNADTSKASVQRIIWGIVFSLVLSPLGRFLNQQYFTPWRQARSAASQIEQLSKTNPVFQQLAKHEPALYEQFKLSMIQKAQGDKTASEIKSTVTAEIAQRFSPVLLKYMAVASSDSLHSFMKITLDAYESALQKDSELCYRQQTQGGLGQRLNQFIVADQETAMLQAMADIIRTGAESPAAPASTTQLQQAQAELRDSMRAIYKDGDFAMLQSPDAPTVDRAKVCRMHLDIFKQILQMPDGESAVLLRYFLTNRSL